MAWNYRVLRYEDAESETGYTFGIYEVYYDEFGDPSSATEDEILLGETPEGLLEMLMEMQTAFDKLVLTEDLKEVSI